MPKASSPAAAPAGMALDVPDPQSAAASGVLSPASLAAAAGSSSSSSSRFLPPSSSSMSLQSLGAESQESQDYEDQMLGELEVEAEQQDLLLRSADKDPSAALTAPTLLASMEGVKGSSGPSASAAPAKTKESQLDFLLNKASEYSNFIARDLEELQENMAMEAQRAAQERAAGGDAAGGGGAGGKKRGAAPKGGPAQKKGKGGGGAGSAAQSDESARLLSDAKARADAGGKKPIFVQPPNLSADCVLKDYQLEGVRWLTSLYENGVSGILADEMGLGKTIQVIALIAHLQTKKVSGPFIVVAPLATLPNWVREFNKWLPNQPVVRYHGTGEERERFMKGDSAPLQKKNRKDVDFPIIVTSYEMAIKDVKKLNSLGEFAYMIVDEGQRLKNRKCCLIKNLKAIDAANRILLSGTPIQNNLDELWSLLNFVNPAIFDDLSVFQSWFGFKDIGKETKEDDILSAQKSSSIVSKLHEILRPFLLRRIKTDVLKEMPPKKEIVVYAGMSKLQQGYLTQIEKGTLREELMRQGIEGAHQLSQINQLMNNRKNSNHPFLFGEPIDPQTGLHLGTAYPSLLIKASGKFNLLDRMLTRLHAAKHQVLIFSQMTEVLSIIEDYLAFRKWNYCRIDGSTKIDDRQAQMDEFNAERTNGAGGTRNDADDRKFVFLLSTRAGGLGINLASADTCIIFDSDWNPHQDSQAMDRCHRIGQTRPVAVYRLLTANSVDIDMMEKQISKKKLDRMAIAGGDFRKGGIRSKGALTEASLAQLLADDIKDIKTKASTDAVEHIRISEEELDAIMDRPRLFGKDDDAIPKEGKMYDILDSKEAASDMLATMDCA